MLEPGVGGEMSLKDIIAHVSWYEREMVGLLRGRALVGSPWWELPLDERNAKILAENRDRPLAEVTAEAKQVNEDLLAALQDLREQELAAPHAFAGMPPEWLPWQVIASNTYVHYPQHAADIEA